MDFPLDLALRRMDAGLCKAAENQRPSCKKSLKGKLKKINTGCEMPADKVVVIDKTFLPFLELLSLKGTVSQV
jgi:hypothetical protein